MQVILLETIKNLGDLGAVVDVRSGYGRNFLIPQGKALPATKDNLAEVEQRRAELEKHAAEQLAAAQERGEKLNEASVTVSSKAGDEGKLFGSLGNRDIADLATAAGIELAKSEVRLPEGPIRQVGEYEIAIQLHAEVEAVLKLHVVAE